MGITVVPCIVILLFFNFVGTSLILEVMRQSQITFPVSEDARGDVSAVFSKYMNTSDGHAIDPQTTMETFALKYHKPIKASTKDSSLLTVVNFQQNVSKSFEIMSCL